MSAILQLPQARHRRAAPDVLAALSVAWFELYQRQLLHTSYSGPGSHQLWSLLRASEGLRSWCLFWNLLFVKLSCVMLSR